MKNITLIIITSLLTLITTAQPPQMFNYQAVVRNASGDPVTGQTVGIQIEILEGSISGTVIYTEVHDVLTNDFGLATLAIGNGTSGDDFTTIDWGADDYFIKVSADIDGGTDYVEMATSQLLSVPYALYAETSETTEELPVYGEMESLTINGYLYLGDNNRVIRGIRELTGTTHATNTYVDFALPSGWSISTTRVLNVEIHRSDSFWSGLGYASSGGTEVPIRYYFFTSGAEFIRVMYPDNAIYKNRAIRVLIMRINPYII